MKVVTTKILVTMVTRDTRTTTVIIMAGETMVLNSSIFITKDMYTKITMVTKVKVTWCMEIRGQHFNQSEAMHTWTRMDPNINNMSEM